MSLQINYYQIDSPESTLFTSAALQAATVIAGKGHIVCKFRVKLKSVGLLPKPRTFISNQQYLYTQQKAQAAGVE